VIIGHDVIVCPQFSRNRLSSEFFGFLGTPSKKGKAGKTEGENEGFSVSLACLVGFTSRG
jgi:hypothetical protein